MTSFTTTYTMKATDLPWLVAIPDHWEVRRLRILARIITGATPSTQDPLNWDGDIEWLTPDDLGKLPTRYVHKGSRSITQKGYESCAATLAPSGSLAISTRAPIGHIGILQQKACVNQGCRLLIPSDLVESAWLYFSLKIFNDELSSYGQGSTFTELSRDKLGDFAIALPPLSEQTVIVAYLDYADQIVRGGVSQKQRLVELMEEYKRAVIQQTVTRGLDPDVHLKPSGVEWLGDIPEHWEVRRMKQAAQLNPSKNEINDILYKDIYVSFLPMELVGTNGDFAEKMAHISEVRNGFTYFRRGDVIVAKITPCFENGKGACLENLSTDFGFGSTEFHVLRCQSSVLPRFLYYTTSLTEFRSQGAESMTGAAGQQRVPQSFVANYPIFLPPISEQAAIVAYLDKLTSDIDAAIVHTRREIELLEEYRTRLIADVVTGKLDVREVASNLPDVNLDDLQPLAEGGEADD